MGACRRMQALIFGIIGGLLGLLTARLGPPAILRRVVLAVASLVGLIVIVALNAMLARSVFPQLDGNLTLGGGVFLLGLWYCHHQGVARRPETRAERTR